MFTWREYIVLDAGFACVQAHNQEDDSVLLALWESPDKGATMEDSLSRARVGACVAGPEWNQLDIANRRGRLFAAVARAGEQGCPGPLLAWLAAAAGCLAATWSQ